MNIVHQPESRRFVYQEDGHTAHLDYRDENGRLNFHHTWVPPELGGRGIASALARHALDHARSEKRLVIPSCSFVAGYIEKHPEYRDLL
ncbi:GNAT family N-acetyltransferase [Neisseria leonii]|uniref:GNAT family N-acetyltransferase n=1 Tax=Neisseria leonii TaxID=2995413 RepID=UPI00237B001D|nr:GNAT family N-acetyltransferase [Neisseria sp. 3986]MDD9326247.1 N-acetyltransferase [Neisseria sp. 3986]